MLSKKQIIEIIEQLNMLNKKIDEIKADQEKIKLSISQLAQHTNLGFPEH